MEEKRRGKGKEKWKLGKTNHKGIGKEMRKENNDGGKYKKKKPRRNKRL